MNGIYRIADRSIGICSMYRDVHTLCKDYIYSGIPDFTIETTQSDIEFERERAQEGAFTDAYLETLAIYRRIADQMTDYDTILFHGSCVAVDGVGYLFTARSGTGKSTHTLLWCEYFKERAIMVNDDKPLVRPTESGVVIYGTPWNGKHKRGENISVPLHAVCILERDKENSIEMVDKKSIYPILIQQIYRPREPTRVVKMLTLVDRLLANLAVYRLRCSMESEAVKVAYEGMKK